MKTIFVAILALFISCSLDAKKAVSLNDAVKEAESEGRVISARTVNDKHEVKVLTPSGTVKTYNINAGGSAKPTQPYNSREKTPRLENYYSRSGQSKRDQTNRRTLTTRNYLQNNSANSGNANRRAGRERTGNSASKDKNNDKDK